MLCQHHVIVSGLEGPVCLSLTNRNAAFWVAAVLWLTLGSAEWVGWAGLLASESLGWLRCIRLQVMLVAVAVEIFVAQMLKSVARADGSFPLPCFECPLEVSQPRF